MNKLVQEYVAERKEKLKEQINRRDVKVRLFVLQVGDNPASNSYIKGKMKDCEEVGIKVEHLKFSEEIDTQFLRDWIWRLNHRDSVHGIIVQLPLPPHIDVKEVQLAINPKKDVDGFHPMSYFKPCTPMGVANYLKRLGYDFVGKNALVIGRSPIVGKPLQELLTDLDCTVTLAHSKTVGIYRHMRDSDIIFTAIDKIEKYEAYDGLHMKYADIVIDIGLGVSRRDNKLHGNLSEVCVEYLKDNHVKVLSGKGGVGLLTRLQLLENTVQASMLL